MAKANDYIFNHKKILNSAYIKGRTCTRIYSPLIGDRIFFFKQKSAHCFYIQDGRTNLAQTIWKFNRF